MSGEGEIVKNAKFLLTLQCKNCIDPIEDLLCDLDHLKFSARILLLASSSFITTQQKSGVAK
jgi:hypothetical protein